MVRTVFLYLYFINIYPKELSKHLENLRPTIKMSLEKAANYCAYQERCQQDVRKKLRELKLDREDTEEVIYLLIKDDFLNEERFAKLYCRSKFNQNKWGKTKIHQHLKQKQISERNINTGLKEIKMEEYHKVLDKLISKKKETLNEQNHWTKKQKIMQYAMQKGFEHEIIKDYL